MSLKMYNIKKQAYVLVDGNRKLFIKGKPPAHLLDIIIGCGKQYGFKKEISIYSYLKNNRLQYLKTADLLLSHNNFFILEYIEGEIGVDSNYFSDTDICNILFDLHFSIDKSSLKFNTSFMKNKTTLSVLKSIVFHIPKFCGVLSAIKALKVFCQGAFSEKKQERLVMLHNDLGNTCNKITSEDKRLIILDFERATYERKWILYDIVALCLNIITLEFNWKLFSIYIEQLNRRGCQIDVNLQLRIALLRQSGGLLAYPDYRKVHKEFMKKTILCEKEFKSWVKAGSVKPLSQKRIISNEQR